jgi:hypothetical protein
MSVFISAIFSYDENFLVSLISKLKLDSSICFFIEGIFLYKLSHGHAVAQISLCHNRFEVFLP